MKKFNIIYYLIIILVIATLSVKGLLIVKTLSKSDTSKIYQIDVDSYNGVDTYLASDFIVDSTTKCLTFHDLLNVKRTVCNKYTISEY